MWFLWPYVFYLDDQNISSALDRLAQPAAPLPSLSSIIPQSRSRSRSRSQSAYQDQLISEEVLIKILQYIFPDSAPTPVEQVINYFWKFIVLLNISLKIIFVTMADSVFECMWQFKILCPLLKMPWLNLYIVNLTFNFF